MRGRKPKPIEQKMAEGNKGKRPLIPLFDEPIDGEIPIPPEVYDDPEAKRYWVHYTTTTAPGHLRPVDGPVLSELCLAMSVLSRINREMQEYFANGGKTVILNDRGAYMNYPGLRAKIHQVTKVTQLLTQLCLTPAERSRVFRDAASAAAAGVVPQQDAFFDDEHPN